jgi:WAS/WASL-interacting protein
MRSSTRMLRVKRGGPSGPFQGLHRVPDQGLGHPRSGGGVTGTGWPPIVPGTVPCRRTTASQVPIRQAQELRNRLRAVAGADSAPRRSGLQIGCGGSESRAIPPEQRLRRPDGLWNFLPAGRSGKGSTGRRAIPGFARGVLGRRGDVLSPGQRAGAWPPDPERRALVAVANRGYRGPGTRSAGTRYGTYPRFGGPLVRTGVLATLALATSFILPGSTLKAQQDIAVDLAASPAVGTAFQGVGVGLADTRLSSSSAFSMGVGRSGGVASDYGVYGGGNWGPPAAYGYSTRGYRNRGYRCVDVWAVLDGPYYRAVDAGFYDDWFYFSDLYYDCILRGPGWAYDTWHAYRPRYYRSHRAFRLYRPRFLHISIHIVDPFWPTWGPYYAYDPWGHYWSNWAVYNAPHTRTVYVTPGPVYRRPSPIYLAGTTFKEDPRGGTSQPGRQAQPRGVPSGAPAASAPAPSRTGMGIQAPPRRSGGVGGSDGGAAAPPPRPTQRTGLAAEPRRTGDDGSNPRAPGPAGNTSRATPDVPRRGDVSTPPPSDGGRGTTPASPSRPAAGRPTSPDPQTQPPPSRPSAPARQAQPAGGRPSPTSPPRTEPSRPSAPVRQTQPPPGRTPAPARQTQPAPDRPSAAAPRTQAAPPPGRPSAPPPRAQAAPDRPTAPPRQAQPAPSRPSASAPQTRPAPSRPSASAPQARPAPSRPSGPAPQARPAPSRPATPPTQAAPGRPSAGASSPRPAPPPRRPGGESDAPD